MRRRAGRGDDEMPAHLREAPECLDRDVWKAWWTAREAWRAEHGLKPGIGDLVLYVQRRREHLERTYRDSHGEPPR